MTFLVGFHCFDGLVLCADSEENDGISKTYVEKLYCTQVNGEPGVCFGFSGDSVIGGKLRIKMLDSMKELSCEPENVESEAETVLQGVIQAYEGDLSILLGHANQTTQTTNLYRSYSRDRALRSIDVGKFDCVGMETSLARFLLESVCDDGLMGIDECLELGIWVTALTKLTTAHVSGPTMAMSYKKGESHWKRHHTARINEIEAKYPPGETWHLLRKYWESKNPQWYQIQGEYTVRQPKRQPS
jgi:hypothetical protein